MILFDATPLQSEHRLRGLGTYTYNLALELVQLCPEDICFATATHGIHPMPEPLRSRAYAARRGHRPAQMYWLYNEWFLRQVTRRVQPSIFHSTDFNGLITPRGVATVATLHDMTPLKEGLRHSKLSDRMSDLRWWTYFYRKLPRASHIIAISAAVKLDAIELLGIPKEKISVIPHGIDVSRFCPGGRRPINRPYLFFVGGRNGNKNLKRVLKAFSLLKEDFSNMALLIAGAWSQRDVQWLKEHAAYLKVDDSVMHLGYVADDELPYFYSNAEVFLFPSFEEGFGLPILEAMACGTPVVTSNRGAMLEVAGRAAQFVDPEEVNSLTVGIRDILTKPILKEHLIKLGFQRASEFSWKSAARKTHEVYHRVAERVKLV